MQRLNTQISFVLIMFLAILLRFAAIDFDSLWLDEGYQSLVSASGQGLPDFLSLKNIPYLFRFEYPSTLEELLFHFREVDPLCPPLYPILLNLWIKLMGQSDLAIRALSSLFSVLSVAALYIFCRISCGARIALAAAFIQAISPFDIHYAQEARMYSLVVLCSILSSGSLICFLALPKKTLSKLSLLVLYTFSSWALINSHYTGLFLLAAQGLCASLYSIYKKDWKLLACLSISWLSIVLLWLPWFPLFLKAASIRKESFYVARAASFLWPFYAVGLRIPINWLSFLAGQRVWGFAAPLYISSAIMLISAAIPCFQKDSAAKDLKWMRYALWLWAIVPAAGLCFIDIMENHRVIEVARYSIYTAPAIYALAGSGLIWLSDKFKWSKWVALTQILFAASNIIYSHSVYQREPWKALAETIENTSPQKEVILISQFYDIALLDRYLTKPRYQLGLSPAMGKTEIEKRLANFPSFALVTAQDGESIKDMLPQKFRLKKQIDFRHGLHLRFYQAEITD